MTIEQLKAYVDGRGYDYHEQVEPVMSETTGEVAYYDVIVYGLPRLGSKVPFCRRVGSRSTLLDCEFKQSHSL